MPDNAANVVKWTKFVLTFAQLGLAVLVIVLVRFQLHGDIDSSNNSNSSSSQDVCLLAPPQEWPEACTYADVVASVSMLFTFLISLMQLYFTNRDLRRHTSSSSSSKRFCGVAPHAVQCALLALASLWWAAAAVVLTHYGTLADRCNMPRADMRAGISAAAWISAGTFLILLGLEIWQQTLEKRRRAAAAAAAAADGRNLSPGFDLGGVQGFSHTSPAESYPGQGRSGVNSGAVPYGGMVMGTVAVPVMGTAIGVPVYAATVSWPQSPAAAADVPQPAAAAADRAPDGDQHQQQHVKPGQAHARRLQQQPTTVDGEGSHAGADASGSDAADTHATTATAVSNGGTAAAEATAGGQGVGGQPAGTAQSSLTSPTQPPAAAAVPPAPYYLQPLRTSVRYAAVSEEDLQPASFVRASSHSSHSGAYINGREMGPGGSFTDGSDRSYRCLSHRQQGGTSSDRRSSSSRGGTGVGRSVSAREGGTERAAGQVGLQMLASAPASTAAAAADTAAEEEGVRPMQ